MVSTPTDAMPNNQVSQKTSNKTTPSREMRNNNKRNTSAKSATFITKKKKFKSHNNNNNSNNNNNNNNQKQQESNGESTNKQQQQQDAPTMKIDTNNNDNHDVVVGDNVTGKQQALVDACLSNKNQNGPNTIISTQSISPHSKQHPQPQPQLEKEPEPEPKPSSAHKHSDVAIVMDDLLAKIMMNDHDADHDNTDEHHCHNNQQSVAAIIQTTTTTTESIEQQQQLQQPVENTNEKQTNFEILNKLVDDLAQSKTTATMCSETTTGVNKSSPSPPINNVSHRLTERRCQARLSLRNGAPTIVVERRYSFDSKRSSCEYQQVTRMAANLWPESPSSSHRTDESGAPNSAMESRASPTTTTTTTTPASASTSTSVSASESKSPLALALASASEYQSLEFARATDQQARQSTSDTNGIDHHLGANDNDSQDDEGDCANCDICQQLRLMKLTNNNDDDDSLDRHDETEQQQAVAPKGHHNEVTSTDGNRSIVMDSLDNQSLTSTIASSRFMSASMTLRKGSYDLAQASKCMIQSYGWSMMPNDEVNTKRLTMVTELDNDTYNGQSVIARGYKPQLADAISVLNDEVSRVDSSEVPNDRADGAQSGDNKQQQPQQGAANISDATTITTTTTTNNNNNNNDNSTSNYNNTRNDNNTNNDTGKSSNISDDNDNSSDNMERGRYVIDAAQLEQLYEQQVMARHYGKLYPPGAHYGHFAFPANDYSNLHRNYLCHHEMLAPLHLGPVLRPTMAPYLRDHSSDDSGGDAIECEMHDNNTSGQSGGTGNDKKTPKKKHQDRLPVEDPASGPETAINNPLQTILPSLDHTIEDVLDQGGNHHHQYGIQIDQGHQDKRGHPKLNEEPPTAKRERDGRINTGKRQSDSSSSNNNNNNIKQSTTKLTTAQPGAPYRPSTGKRHEQKHQKHQSQYHHHRPDGVVQFPPTGALLYGSSFDPNYHQLYAATTLSHPHHLLHHQHPLHHQSHKHPVSGGYSKFHTNFSNLQPALIGAQLASIGNNSAPAPPGSRFFQPAVVCSSTQANRGIQATTTTKTSSSSTGNSHQQASKSNGSKQGALRPANSKLVYGQLHPAYPGGAYMYHHPAHHHLDSQHHLKLQIGSKQLKRLQRDNLVWIHRDKQRERKVCIGTVSLALIVLLASVLFAIFAIMQFHSTSPGWTHRLP